MIRRKEFDTLRSRVAFLEGKDVLRDNSDAKVPSRIEFDLYRKDVKYIQDDVHEWATYCSALIKFLGVEHKYVSGPNGPFHYFAKISRKGKK